eukprot:1449398-Pyramimonas_sp.AAC.1
MSELDTLRTMAAASRGVKAAGRSRTLALLMTPSPKFDPIYRATLEPVKAFMHAIWRARMPISTLQAGLAAAAA